jgi:hypothetical protein
VEIAPGFVIVVENRAGHEFVLSTFEEFLAAENFAGLLGRLGEEFYGCLLGAVVEAEGVSGAEAGDGGLGGLDAFGGELLDTFAKGVVLQERDKGGLAVVGKEVERGVGARLAPSAE